MQSIRRFLVFLLIPAAVGAMAASLDRTMVEWPAPTALAADDPRPPAEPVKLIFIHHSTGGNWLADTSEHEYAGGLGRALMDNNYYVSATNYGWGRESIGDLTDIGNWWTWFRGPDRGEIMGAVYSESGQNVGDFGSWSRLASDPGGENEIVLFKSCFPNSHLGGSPGDPATTGNNPLRGTDAYAGDAIFNVANAKGIYNDLLEYFASHQDKLFVVITAPALADDDMYIETDASHAANARALNNWLVNDWLDSYPYTNVAVFDFFNVLTSNGGDPETSDLGQAGGNHHRWRNGAVEHVQNVNNDFSSYSMWLDSHPTGAGGQKATGEILELLNVFYHRWRSGGGSPTPTATATATPTPTATAPPIVRGPRRAMGRIIPGGGPPTATPTRTPTPTPSPPPGGGLVELTVSEATGVSRLAEPVTSGLPLPRSANIRDLDTLRLVDGSGSVVPAQLTALARWGGGPDDTTRPVRWALLDFQATVGAGDSATYRLRVGGGEPTYPTLVITDVADRVGVDTGAVSFSFNRDTGTITADRLASSMYSRATGTGGTTYTSEGPMTVSVETDGAMRASVKVTGSYRSSGGAALLDYTSRYWFHAGSPVVRLFHTVENNTPCPVDSDGQVSCYDIGSAGSVVVDDVSLVVPTDLEGTLRYSVSGDGDSVDGDLDSALVLHQDSSGTDSWDRYPEMTGWQGEPLDTRPRMQAHVSFRGYRTTVGGAAIDSGDQATGRLSVEDSGHAWSVAVRDFWQSFPKALRARTDGVLEVGLFPEEFGPSGYGFTLRSGEHKTHELWLAPLASVAAAPLFAVAPTQWYVESGAFGLTTLPNRQEWPDHEDFIRHQLDTAPTFEGWMDWYPNLPAAIEGTDFYGIYDYGDVPLDYEGYHVAPMNLKYNMTWGMWQQWARAGDRRWFHLAEAAGRHMADIDIMHNLHSPRHWIDGIVYGHSYHDEDGFTNPHRNEGGNHPDTVYGVPGLLATYYLTGYEKALDAAIEVADCIEYRVGNDSNLCHLLDDCSGEGWGLGIGMYDAGCRPAANALTVLVEAYRATTDPRYLRVADALVEWAAANDQPYMDGPTGEELAMRPWMLNSYLLALSSYLEMCEEHGLGDDADGRGSLVDYAVWLHDWPWLDIDAVDAGARAAYPYEWWFNEAEWNDEPSVNNWLLAGADAMAYAYRLTGSSTYLEWGERLFRAGSRDPWWEDDANTYSATKETANSVTFGHVFLHQWEASHKRK